jgi:two-component system, NarL family, sensor kinase
MLARYLGILALGAAQAVIIVVFLAGRSRYRRLKKDHERATAALKESEAKNEAILTALPDMMFVLDKDGTYLDWYAKDPSGLYAPPETFLGKNMRHVMPPELAEVLADSFRKVLSSGEPETVEYTLVIHSETKFFETRIVKCGDGRLLSIVRDLTEKKHAEQQLQQLSSRLLSLQDEERRRIAGELHDVTAQNLFAITINLETLRQQMTDSSPSGMEILNECQNLCEQSLQEVRTLSYTLHPPALDRHGVMPTLHWYIQKFGERTGMEISLDVSPDLGRLPLEMETDIFRVVQEGLSNIVRHSGSRTASVEIKKRSRQFVLQIKDNGRGLPDRTAESENGSRFGVGLPSMRERVRRWGGHLHIRSGDDGVLLLIHVPIPQINQSHETVTHSKQASVS